MDSGTSINIKNKNKYLIILSGSPRGGQKTWESLVQKVKNPLSADLALSYGDKFTLPKYLKDNCDYDWMFSEEDNWKKYFEKELNNDWEEFFLKGKKYGMAGGIDNNTGSGAIVSGLKNILYRNHLETIKQYKYIIHSRFDQFYIHEHEEFSGDKIWIPEGEDYFGICDRHAVFPSKYAEKFFNICEYIDNYKSFGSLPEKITPESVLLYNLKINNLEKKIVRYPRTQFTVSNKNDETRWRVAKYNLYFYKDLKIKYPDEFLDSFKSINKKGIFFKFFIKNKRLYANYSYLMLRIKLGEIKRLFKGKNNV